LHLALGLRRRDRHETRAVLGVLPPVRAYSLVPVVLVLHRLLMWSLAWQRRCPRSCRRAASRQALRLRLSCPRVHSTRGAYSGNGLGHGTGWGWREVSPPVSPYHASGGAPEVAGTRRVADVPCHDAPSQHAVRGVRVQKRERDPELAGDLDVVRRGQERRELQSEGRRRSAGGGRRGGAGVEGEGEVPVPGVGQAERVCVRVPRTPHAPAPSSTPTASPSPPRRSRRRGPPTPAPALPRPASRGVSRTV
jgi:hypothetical protein